MYDGVTEIGRAIRLLLLGLHQGTQKCYAGRGLERVPMWALAGAVAIASTRDWPASRSTTGSVHQMTPVNARVL
jgi:hypothetical protein